MKDLLTMEIWTAGHEAFVVDFLFSFFLPLLPFLLPSRASQVCGSLQGKRTTNSLLKRTEKLKRLTDDSRLLVSQSPTLAVAEIDIVLFWT